MLRALEITAYQSPKTYSEQARKVDMAPAAPMKPGKPVAEWDAATKPEQHRRIPVVGMGLYEAHQLAVDARAQHEAVELLAVVV